MDANWEYQVFSVGSSLRGVKDDELAGALNQLSADGWEIINVGFPYGGKPKIVARRQQSGTAQRQRNWPGEKTAR